MATRSMSKDEPIARHVDPLRPFTLMDTIVSCALWPVAVTQMAAWLPIFRLLDLTLLPGDKIDDLARFVCRVGTRSVGIRVSQRGLHNLEPGQNYLICINHVSLLDTPVLVQSVPVFARSFQDIQHFKIPLYGEADIDIPIRGNIPVQLDVAVPISKALAIRANVPVSFAISKTMAVDIDTTVPISIGLPVRVPVETEVVVPFSRTLPIQLEVPVVLDVPVDIALGDTPFGQVLRDLARRLRPGS